MPNEKESWITSESLWLIGIVLAFILIFSIASGKVTLEGGITATLALLYGIWRVWKGKDPTPPKGTRLLIIGLACLALAGCDIMTESNQTNIVAVQMLDANGHYLIDLDGDGKPETPITKAGLQLKLNEGWCLNMDGEIIPAGGQL